MTSVVGEQLRWTIDDLEGLPDNGSCYEIIDGELFVTRAPHWDHQTVVGAIYAALRAWSQSSGLGQAGIGPGLIFSSTDAVIPDVVWSSHDRLATALDDSGHLTVAPELVVEVLSLSQADKKRDRQTKVKLYSLRGVQEYWIADRECRSFEVYQRSGGLLKLAVTLYETDSLTSPLLPGFSCAISTLWT